MNKIKNQPEALQYATRLSDMRGGLFSAAAAELRSLYARVQELEASESRAAPVLSNEQIKAVFLANGFTIKEGLTDLKPYVYQAARALLNTVVGKSMTRTAEPADPILQMIRDQEAKKNALIAEGTCPTCEGKGECGGQFQGGEWTCEDCNGSGRYSTKT